MKSPDWDRYDAPPSNEITRTLAHALRRNYSYVAPRLVEIAPQLSEEGRRSLFKAVSRALHDLGQDVASPNVSDLVQLAVDRLSGDWGQGVATDSAVALSDLARSRPNLLVGRAADLVGVLIVEITQPAPEPLDLAVAPNPLAGLEAYGRRQLRQTRIARLQSAVGSLVEAGADDAAQALFDLLDAEDNGSPEAVEVRVAATRLLGKVGARPVQLPAVVPRLYTGLLHAEPSIRSAAVRSWADLARQPQPLPSTLLDLLPSLIFDGPVILPVLDLLGRLRLSEDRRPELLASVVRIAYGLHNTSFDGTDTVLAGCIEALRCAESRSPGRPNGRTARRGAHRFRSFVTARSPRRAALAVAGTPRE